MTEDSISSRLVRIETTQQQHSETLARVAVAVEAIAVISERMANHVEDTKRLHQRVDSCEDDIMTLQTQTAETHTFYQDVRNGIWVLIGIVGAGGSWLLKYWLEQHP